MSAPKRFGQMLVYENESDRDRPATTSGGSPVDQWDEGALTYVMSTGRLEVWNGTGWVNVTTGPNFAVLDAGDPDPQAGDFLPDTLVFRKLV